MCATNSFNHYAYGAVGDWLYRVVAGMELDPRRPAYKRVIIGPRPGGSLTFAAASLETVHGLAAIRWERQAQGLAVEVIVPANTEGMVYLPAASGEGIREGNRPLAAAVGVREIGPVADSLVIRVGSGSYRFQVPAV